MDLNTSIAVDRSSESVRRNLALIFSSRQPTPTSRSQINQSHKDPTCAIWLAAATGQLHVILEPSRLANGLES